MPDIKNETTGVFLKLLSMAARIAFALPVILICGAVAVVFAADAFSLTAAFAREGVLPMPFIFYNIFLCMIFVSLTLLGARILFYKKLGKITYGSIGFAAAAFFTGALICFVANSAVTDGWELANYPGYIEKMNTKVLYQTVPRDYGDTVYLEGYFDFLNSDFRPVANVEVVREPSLTDSFRVEVKYKGLDSEIYINEYDGKQNISVYLKNYDYELKPEDYAYMYKNHINLEYSKPLAIEKIIIRTAYPEKIDISGITSW